MGQGRKRRVLLAAVVGLALLAGLIALLWLLQSYLPDVNKYKDLADLVQTALTVLALLGGAAFAAYKLELFRDFEPHLTLTHTINHRPVGDSYVHIDIVVRMHNSSRVRVDLHEGFWTLQQIPPLSDTEVEQIYLPSLEADLPEFPWPALNEGVWVWDRGELAIEPGASHHELLEFIVPDDIKALIIYTFCYSPPVPEETGWDLATVFDIID